MLKQNKLAIIFYSKPHKEFRTWCSQYLVVFMPYKFVSKLYLIFKPSWNLHFNVKAIYDVEILHIFYFLVNLLFFLNKYILKYIIYNIDIYYNTILESILE